MLSFQRLTVCGVLLLGSLAAHGAAAQGTAKPPQPSVEERLKEAAIQNRHRLDFDGATFSGPAWDMLVREGSDAQFFMLGEEHGIAENPKLAAALVKALAPTGYTKVAIEVSPPMATALDRAVTEGGLDGLRALYAKPGGEPAFFGMKEEAEWLVAAREAIGGTKPYLWGADYEVGGDRLLIARLEAKKKPEAAREALAALKEASLASWAKYEETRNPQFIYSFSGDPALVRAVRDAWPRRDDEASSILDTLEETFEINAFWVAGKGYESNEQRSALMRKNFAKYWRAEKKAGRAPKVFAKFGASHVTRGRNMTETYDLGALIPEIATLEGGKAFNLLVLPGAGSMTAVFNPMQWAYQAAPATDGYAQGIEPIIGQAFPDAFTLIDLRPLRPILGRWREGTHPELMRTVHGFDAVLVMSGSTPSANFSE
jgi:hypothetical protein